MGAKPAQRSLRYHPTSLSVPSTDLEVYNVGSHQDTQTLQKVPNHMDEGCSDTRVLLLLLALFMALVTRAVPMSMALPLSVAVPMSRLMKGQPHSMETDKAQWSSKGFVSARHSRPYPLGLTSLRVKL